MKRSCRSIQYTIGRSPAAGVSSTLTALAAVVLLIMPAAHAVAQSSSSCEGGEVCTRLQELQSQLESVRDYAVTTGTLKEALDGSVSFLVCSGLSASAGAGLGLGLPNLEFKLAGGAGEYAVGNGVAGFLVGNTSAAFSPSLDVTLAGGVHPCVDVHQIHSVRTGEPVFETCVYDISAEGTQVSCGFEPESEAAGGNDACPGCSANPETFVTSEQTHDGTETLLGQDQGGNGAASPVQVLNTIVSLIKQSGVDVTNVDDVARVLSLDGSLKHALNFADTSNKTGLADILDNYVKLPGELGAADLDGDHTFYRTREAIRELLHDLPDPCNSPMLTGTWCNDAKEAAGSMTAILQRAGDPLWVDEFEKTANYTQNVSKMAGHAESAGMEMKSWMDAMDRKVGRLENWREDVIYMVTRFPGEIRDGLEEIKDNLCKTKVAVEDVFGCSVTVRINICAGRISDMASLSGSCGSSGWNPF